MSTKMSAGAARCCVIATALLLGACVEFDSGNTGTGSAEGGTDNPGEPLEGHRVRCCFRGHYDVSNEHCGCAESFSYCIDPEVWDADDDDDLSGSELQAFCQQKCEPAWNVNEDPANGWTHRECGAETMVGQPSGLFTSCLALNPDQAAPYLLPETRLVPGQEFSCDPNDDGLESYAETPYSDDWPRHKGTFSSATPGGAGVEIEISGNELVPEYELTVEFALEEGCDVDGGTCILTLSNFEMDTTAALEVGDYTTIGGSMTLNERVVADVVFDPCSHGVCTGEFLFNKDEDNQIGINLFWVQRGPFGVDDGALHIPQIDLVGVLELDEQGESGTLQLTGSGSGYFGSDWATVELDIVGDVDPL